MSLKDMEALPAITVDTLYMVCVPCGRISYIDPSFIEFLALQTAQSELLNQRWQDILPPQLHIDARCASDSVCNDLQTASFECELLGQSCLISVKPLLDSDGNLLALSWHGQALQNARFYQGAFEHSYVSQWVVSLDPLLGVLRKHGIKSVADISPHLGQQSELFAEFRWQLKVLKSNAAARKLFQLAETDDFRLELVHHLTEHGLVHIANQLLHKEQGLQFFHQDILLHGNPKTFWFSCEAADSALYFSAMDVSSLKTAEKNLEEREQFLAAVLKAIPDYLMVYDFRKEERVFQNKNLLESLGYDALELEAIGKKTTEFIAADDVQMSELTLNSLQRTLQGGNVFESKLRLKQKNGDLRNFYFRSAALETQGRINNAVIIARDITDALKAESSYNEKQRHYQLLADNITDVVVTTDTLFGMNFASSSMRPVLGYDSDEFIGRPNALELLGLSLHKERMAVALADSAMQVQGTLGDYEDVFETQAITASGDVLEIEVKLSILRDKNKALEGMLIVLRDISERKDYENNQRLAAKVFENSMDGIYITDQQGLIRQVNRTFSKITGYDVDDVIGKKPSFLGSGWHDSAFSQNIIPSVDEHGEWSGELMSRRENGEAFLVWMSISKVKNIKGEALGLITTFKDITEAKSSEESIRKLAYFDPLTELPNRLLFQDRLYQAVQSAMRNRFYVAVLFLDLDGFKIVNDTHGHALGDHLLTEVAQRLQNCVRADDTVARMGGDEFTVILHALKTREQAESAASQISTKILQLINEPFEIQGKLIEIGASIGIALYPDDGIEEIQLIKHADTAMYHAKENGKNNYQFFTDDMHQRAAQRQLVEKNIQSALQSDEFILAYQAKVDLSGKKLLGFEALLRWQHPEKGLMPPNTFLKSFDELGLGSRVGARVLTMACEKIQQLSLANSQCNRISINVFARHFRDSYFIAHVRDAIAHTKIDAGLLTLEISESILMADVGMAFSILSELKKLGVMIAVDDFAMGLSSLQYLRRLPVDELKIDRQMLAQIDKDSAQLVFVEALIDFAKKLQYKVAIEGVERASQLALLQSSGCDSVQGFYFSRPLLAPQLDEFMQLQRE